MVSPFDLSQALPVGGGLSIPCSLPGPPVVKQLMQMVTMARVGGFSQCASPNQKETCLSDLVACIIFDFFFFTKLNHRHKKGSMKEMNTYSVHLVFPFM